jgi:hypothetical protein
MSSFMKVLPVGAELFHVEVRRDVTTLAVAFRIFANASKNGRKGLGVGACKSNRK